MNKNKIKLHRWQTDFSDVAELYFEKLINEDCNLSLLFKDGNGLCYTIQFKTIGPYMVVDEAYRSEYWQNKELGLGWSFEVANSAFINYFAHESLLERQANIRHLVIASMDVIFEVLAVEYPLVFVSEELESK